ncbi:proton-conducting transporter membrane subunit, partial [Nocardia brasiliensis]|uniref:proton-conducting transporter transmembrane domain-containing protein n=1 Tax=Nocardia brasiliensis TaxID=37326 RepID=UPI0024583D45
GGGGGGPAPPPVLAVLFLIPALNLGGIPPFSGFIGKVALLQAGAQDGSALAWVLVGGSVLTSLLTLYAVARVWSKAFWRPRAEAPEGHLSAAHTPTLIEESTDVLYDERTDPGRMPLSMVASTAALVAVSLSLTVLAGPMLRIADRAAADLADPGVYITAVLGDSPPAEPGGRR